mgnify:CR=1 FL=1
MYALSIKFFKTYPFVTWLDQPSKHTVVCMYVFLISYVIGVKYVISFIYLSEELRVRFGLDCP